MCVHNAVLHPRVWTTWWLWRGEPTRSHLELGREDPQRRWYCVLRRGRVGRCQVFQARGCDHPTAYKPTQTSQHLQSYPPAVLLTQIASADPAARTPQTPQGNNTPAHKSRRAKLKFIAGWSSPVARRAHNPKVAGSNPAPATTSKRPAAKAAGLFFLADRKEGQEFSPACGALAGVRTNGRARSHHVRPGDGRLVAAVRILPPLPIEKADGASCGASSCWGHRLVGEGLRHGRAAPG